MFRRLVLILLPLALLAAACGGGSGGPGAGAPSDSSQEPPADGRDAIIVADDGGDGVQLDSSQGSSEAAGDTAAVSDDVEGNLFASFNPFDLLGTIGGVPASGEIDPNLGAVLLQPDDLPDEYASVTEFAFSTSSDIGEIELAGRMFSTGDLESEDLSDMGSMVMSGVMALPPEAVEELAGLANLEAEFGQYQAEIQELGFGELHLLDAAGLGEGGVGIHMTLDFGGLLGDFASLDEESPPDVGISMDMYLIPRGDRMLMLMVMWPAGEPSGVDSRALVEIMDGRAAAAF